MIRALLPAMIASAAFAQQPAIENATVQTRPFSGSLATQLAQFGPGPFWAGYREPSVAGRHGDSCCSDDGCRGYAPGTPVRLEGQKAVIVLIRMEAGQAGQLRTLSPDCSLDGGGLPFYWIDAVPADASVAWLKPQVTGDRAERALSAIAMHAGPAADRALEDLTAVTQPEKIRERSAFWLGTTRGSKGLEVLERVLANDPSDKVREQVVFAMSQNKEPAGLQAVIAAARTDRSPHVRERALTLLAQKAGDKQAAEVINNAALTDSDRAVKERAVQALKQLPADQGIPLLINLAKSNSDPNVRKKALFWLGQSSDARALDFIAQVLKP